MQFNENQKEAIRFMDGPCCVIAGAGSGKTAVLVNRIQRLIQENIPQQRILAVTFSRKAAAEMSERLFRLCGDTRVTVSTFHQLGYRILNSEPGGFVYQKNSIPDYLKHDFIKARMGGTVLEEWGISHKEVAKWIGTMKNQMIHWSQKPQDAGPGSDFDVSYDIYKAYERYKEENGFYDYDDMTDIPVYRLRANPDLQKYMQGRYDYILVDEYQDTGASQRMMLQMITDRRKNVFVVGDDYQGIYKFRGADIDNILKFHEHFPRAKMIALDTNYRSTPEIVAASNALIYHNTGQRRKHVVSGNPSNGLKPTFTTYATVAQEAAGIAQRIAGLVADGAAYSDMAILYRLNAQSRALEEALFRNEIPFRIYGGKSFFQQPYVCDMMDYLRLAADPMQPEPLLRILNKPNRYLSNKYRKAVKYCMGSQQVSALKAIRILSRSGEWKRSQKALDLVTHVLTLNKNSNLPSSMLLDYVCENIGYTAYMEQDPGETPMDERREAKDDLYTLAEKYPNIKDLVAYAEMQIATYEKYSNDPNTVTLSTVHKSKGLEFGCVFIANCIAGLYPLEQDNLDIEEERRMMYVAMTRAINRLEMSACEEYKEQVATVSPFIGEIANYIAVVNLPRPQKMRKG